MRDTLLLYGRLLRDQWRLRVRSFAWRRHWIGTLLLALLGLYIVLVLVSAGFFWRELVHTMRPGRHPVLFLNEHLLTIFVALFTLRFFLQRTPRMRIQPYLRLPVTHSRLVHFFQLSSLFSIHNLVPFLFLVPYWVRHIHGTSYPAGAAWAWLGGAALIVLFSHYMNNLLRAALRHSREGFAIVLGVLVLLVALDLLLGPLVMNRASTFIFETLFAQEPVILLSLLALIGVVYGSSSLLLRHDLLREPDDEAEGRVVLWQVPFASHHRPVMNLMLLELKMMWRSERPKLYFLFSVVFATVYVSAPLLNADLLGSNFVRALTGIFASGIFALNYGQFMFAWESSYFDGILARDVPLSRMAFAKLALLQLSCVAFFAISLPLFLALAPQFVPLHVAFLFYNAGISSVLMMVLAVRNRKSIRLTNVGFFNYEGFSLLHWLWFLPTVLPPALLMVALRERPDVALMVIGGVGLFSILLTGPWAALLGRRLERGRYAMAAGFRSNAS